MTSCEYGHDIDDSSIVDSRRLVIFYLNMDLKIRSRHSIYQPLSPTAIELLSVSSLTKQLDTKPRSGE